MTTNLMPRVSGSLIPKGTNIVNFMKAGLSPTTFVGFSPAQPPQSGSTPYLTHDVGQSHGADCPTCNLVEVPYNPNLPVLSYQG